MRAGAAGAGAPAVGGAAPPLDALLGALPPLQAAPTNSLATNLAARRTRVLLQLWCAALSLLSAGLHGAAAALCRWCSSQWRCGGGGSALRARVCRRQASFGSFRATCALLALCALLLPHGALAPHTTMFARTGDGSAPVGTCGAPASRTACQTMATHATCATHTGWQRGAHAVAAQPAPSAAHWRAATPLVAHTQPPGGALCFGCCPVFALLLLAATRAWQGQQPLRTTDSGSRRSRGTAGPAACTGSCLVQLLDGAAASVRSGCHPQALHVARLLGAHGCRALLLLMASMLTLRAHAVVDSRMYTRLACPTVKHRWVAASQYLNSTTWVDGVQTGAQDALLLCSDTGTPAISKPYYDTSTQSVLFSPRSNSATTGPYVNLQSVHFGTGDFTFVILAKYNAPGTPGDRWPRIFDFSTTGNQQGTYFILTEVRRGRIDAPR
jgi:hypothetical protein